MSNLKKYRYRFLVALFILGLAITFPSVVLSYIIEPIAVLLWAAWRIISTVNQSIYWSILIATCSLLMLRLVPSWKKRARPAYAYKYAPRNRVEHWRALLGDSILAGNDSALLRQNLEKLICSVLSLSQGSNSGNLQQLVVDERLSLPPEVRHFLVPTQEKPKPRFALRQFHSRLLRPRWLHKRIRAAEPDTTSIAEILTWMENNLEIRHGS